MSKLSKDKIVSIEEYGESKCVDITIEDPNVFFLANGVLTHNSGRSVNIITDAELGDSYGKFRTVDYAVSLNQTEEEFDRGQMRVYVMKSRNGKTRFVVPMGIDYNTLRMTEGPRATDNELEERD